MEPQIDTVLDVDTPEHLAFRTRIAGPGRRMFAWLIDLAVRAVAVVAGIFLIDLVFRSVDLEGMGSGVLYLGLFALDWGYFVGSEMLTGGRSPGKMALRLRVVRANGLPLTWRESSLRNLVRAADLAMFHPFYLAIGPIVMALDSKFRRLGDFAAGTIVIVEESTRVSKEPPLAPNPELVAALPSRIILPPSDLEAIDLFVHRAHMSAERREELADIVAEHVARRIGVEVPRGSSATFLASVWARAQESRRRASS